LIQGNPVVKLALDTGFRRHDGIDGAFICYDTV